MKHLFFLILICSFTIMSHAQPLDLTSSNPLHQALKTILNSLKELPVTQIVLGFKLFIRKLTVTNAISLLLKNTAIDSITRNISILQAQ